jgi:hypothetical protein
MFCAALFVCSVVLLTLSGDVTASGAGRAFPIDSENYVTEQFQTINSRLEWDPTNFLVDLAGHYANCKAVNGQVRVDRLTPEGQSIGGMVEVVDGARTDVDSVNSYIRTTIDRWMRSRVYNDMIRGGSRFGCSIRPGCSGRAAISCLFSPAGSVRPIEPDDYEPADEPKPPENIVAEQAALAFTAQQYEVAERFTGNKWDRSHFLENLSGFETRCEMIDNDNWPFTTARQFAAQYGVRISSVYGSAPNTGSTDEALNEILSKFKSIRLARDLGCSIIPDCIRSSGMYAVVACIYSEP